jgi:hypothetical protein
MVVLDHNLSHNMFEALHHSPEKVAIRIEDVYDKELQLSLENLSNSVSKQEAIEVMNSTTLQSVLDLAGRLQPIQNTDDIRKIAEMTAKWFVLGRAQPALESFLNVSLMHSYRILRFFVQRFAIIQKSLQLKALKSCSM